MNYGVLCDLLVLDPDTEKSPDEQSEVVPGKATYYYELPGDWAMKHVVPKHKDVWFILMKDHKQRFPTELRAESGYSLIPDLQVTSQPCSAFIQPVIRRYHQGELVEELSMGSSPIVRVDKHVLHGDNNPQRNANKLKNLFCRQFGQTCIHDENLFSDELFSEVFTPWTEEEKMNYIRKRDAGKQKYRPCHFDLKPAPTFDLGDVKEELNKLKM